MESCCQIESCPGPGSRGTRGRRALALTPRLAAILGSAVVAVAIATATTAGSAQLLVGVVAIVIVTVSACVTAAVQGLRSAPPDRLWRMLMAANFGLGAAGAGINAWSIAVNDRVSSTYSELIFLGAGFLTVGVLATYPTERLEACPSADAGSRLWYVTAVLDGIIIIGSIALLAWPTVLEPLSEFSGEDTVRRASALLRISVTVLTVALFVMIGSFRRPRNAKALGLLATGLFVYSVMQGFGVYLMATGGPFNAFINVGLMGGSIITASATLTPTTPGGMPREGSRSADVARKGHLFLPYLPLSVLLIFALVRVLSDESVGRAEITVGLLLVGLVVVRQLLVLLQNTSLLDRVEEARRLLLDQALHDPLTGLPNRTVLQERLVTAMERSAAGGSATALLFCDLDDFKVVNDTLGHDTGDQVLCIVAARLRACVRHGDVVARLGGDEFAVLLESDEPPTRVAERIVKAVGEPILVENRHVCVLASVGIAVDTPGASERSHRPSSLLRDADAAMYAAKRRGKGLVVLADQIT